VATAREMNRINQDRLIEVEGVTTRETNTSNQDRLTEEEEAIMLIEERFKRDLREDLKAEIMTNHITKDPRMLIEKATATEAETQLEGLREAEGKATHLDTNELY
jgi:N-methylhydantoinase B/oxoprolinase/acetone carboxylase alpha subunit